MSTSIDDLFTTLECESRRSWRIDPRDAALALDWSARLLNRLRDDWPETDEACARDDVIRRLADSCSQASIAFDRGHGRVSDLVGVLHDAASRPGNGLTRDDRWAVAARLATLTRRLAGVIAASGPYADVPQLLCVADRSRELQHAVAVDPPELTDMGGLDQPITSALSHGGQTPTAVVVEATACMAAEFRSYARDPMTVRELVAVCHATSRVAEYAVTVGGMDVEGVAITDAWRKARDTVAMYSDGIGPTSSNVAGSRVIAAALAVDDGVSRATDSRDLQDVSTDLVRHESDRLDRLLQKIARNCATEFERIGDRLFVPHRDRPLHEDRVGEWLRHEPFLVQPPDLFPAFEAIECACIASSAIVQSRRIRLQIDQRELHRGVIGATQAASVSMSG